MTLFRLIRDSLAFYWRTHLAVLLGVAAGAAVIGGALIVGDSVRASLREMTLQRLGDVDFAVSGTRFVTEDLADRLQANLKEAGDRAVVAPALAMRGGLTHAAGEAVSRAGGVDIYGVDDRLWTLLEHGNVQPPGDGEAVINRRVADALQVSVGDSIALNIEVPSAIPRESLLGERNDLTRELPLTVAAILPDELGASRFGLNPSQQIPSVAFVSLNDLQNTLDLAAVRASRRNPKARPARVNSLFVGQGGELETSSAMSRASVLTRALGEGLALDDLGLRIVPAEDRGYVSIESVRMILDEASIDAIRDAADALSADRATAIARSPVTVYLVNELAGVDEANDYAMYSVVAGVDFASLKPPFGPFDYVAGGPPEAPDEIVLNDFVAEQQLKVAVGDDVALKYFTVGSHGELPEEERRFRVAGIVKLTGAAADPHLTPMLEGITDADTFSDWDQPFEMNLDRITAADEEYWDEHRATPKAFLPLDVAQELFRSRYGKLTSVRVAIPDGMTSDDFAAAFEQQLLDGIDPAAFELSFLPVKEQGLRAAAGTTDFTGLFLAFSFFLILSAAILIALLFRLGVERRAAGIGLLLAIGFTPSKVRHLHLVEGLIVVLAGAVVGTAGAVAYAGLMMHGLRTWWVGAVGTRFLFLSVEPESLLIGFASSVVVALLAVWWGLRQLHRLTPRALLAGATMPEVTMVGKIRRGRRTGAIAAASAAIALLLVIGGLLDWIPTGEAFGGFNWQVIAFFVAGAMFLTAALTGLAALLNRDRSSGLHSGAGLAVRNTSRQSLRSVSTVGLIACATFVLVAVAASRRDPSVERPDRNSGNGGFLLVAESTTPLPFAIDTPAGRDNLGFRVEHDSRDAERLTEMSAISFRVRPGDDASCLNLYRTGLPTILGVPETLVDRGGFKFTATPGENPWTLLSNKLPPTDVPQRFGKIVKGHRQVPTIPVFGDANTLIYSLKKGIGDRIAVPNDDEPEYVLQIAGMLDGSVFQGVLLMSEANFLDLYPSQDGYGYFLIEAPSNDEVALAQLLETQLSPYGFDTEPVADRIADFLAVQNTYLSTFQTLGGLGLLLGTVGLGTVMLRNVIERRPELALMRAVGFRNAKLAWIVLLENAILLMWGLASGTIAALLAVSPHLTSRGADVPVLPGLLMLIAVAAAGMLAALLAVRAAVRTPIVSTLRGE